MSPAIPTREASLPAVSVIVPSYNADERYVARFVRSALAQTFDDFEVLFVDDGSDEGHLATLRDALAADRRLRLVASPHGGVSRARNTGMAEARGAYVAFSDIDDEMLPTFLEEAVALMGETEADLVIGRPVYQFSDARSEFRFFPEGSADTRVLSSEEELDALQMKFISNWTPNSALVPANVPVGPWARLFRREVLEGVAFKGGLRLGEDALFNYEASRHCSRVVLADRPWYLYYQNADSASFRGRIADLPKDFGLGTRGDGSRENAWCGRDCFYLLVMSEKYLRAKGLRGAPDVRRLLASAPAREAFVRFDSSEFEMPSWWRAMCRMLGKGLVTPTTALLAAKVGLSKLRGKRMIG